MEYRDLYSRCVCSAPPNCYEKIAVDYHSRPLNRLKKIMPHSRVSPSAHLTSEHPALIVSGAPNSSRDGFTSTWILM